MADDEAEERPEAEDKDADPEKTSEAPGGRDEDHSQKKRVRKALLEIFADVDTGFRDQGDRANDQMDYWDIYDTKLSGKQFYSGNSKVFVPIVHSAINARVTRFANQIFPVSGRYVEVTTGDRELPQGTMALLEHYVRKAKLRTKVTPALIKNGDIEGQYNIYVTWSKKKRHVAMRIKALPKDGDGAPIEGDEEHDDIKEETIEDAHPTVEVLPDADVLILPATADTVEEALADGGSATILRRWSKASIRQKIKEGVIDKEEGQALLKDMGNKSPDGQVDLKKEHVDAAGIKGGHGKKFALVYETWVNVKIERGEDPKLCVAYYGGKDKILGCKRNPNWSDRCNLLSVPVKKISGVFKGQSNIKPVADMQYAANDAINEGLDSAAYALMPIIMTDPEKNPRIGSMILSLAAVWETSPNDTKFAQFPQLWKQAFEIVASAQQTIFQVLGVNPAMITEGSGNKKKNQAEIAKEQQVDILTTADSVTVIEEGILSPLLGRFAELDHQYRDKKITVRQFGEMGHRANMEEVEPIQMDRRYYFRWFGVEAARSAQQIQQQISMVNVITKIPPQMYQGHKLNLAPLITQVVENTFGPRLGPLIFEDQRSQMSLDPETENDMLQAGFLIPVHQMDNDAEHIQKHIEAAKMIGGDQHKTFQTHVLQHQMQMQTKQQQQQQAQQGPPGGAKPNGAGPRPGAQAQAPRGGQQPPGAVHKDQMHTSMPRKM
jgi:hypothetical protein